MQPHDLGSETLAEPHPSYLSHGILQRWAALLPGARRGELTGSRFLSTTGSAGHEAGEGVSPAGVWRLS